MPNNLAGSYPNNLSLNSLFGDLNGTNIYLRPNSTYVGRFFSKGRSGPKPYYEGKKVDYWCSRLNSWICVQFYPIIC